MFRKKKTEDRNTFNTVNLVVGMARMLELNPVKLVKHAIDFQKNTLFINQMNKQIEKEAINATKKK